MNYNEAHNFIFNEIGDEGYTILDFIAQDKMLETIELIIKLTNCNKNDAKAIWVDLKTEYGTEENNPFLTPSTLSHEEQVYNNAQAREVLNKPKCQYCQSTNIKKIGVIGRSVSIGMFGLASGKVGKQWHCNSCNSDF